MTVRTLLGLCLILALAAWAASNHLRATAARSSAPPVTASAAPRPILQPETALTPGAPVTTPDGIFTLRAERIGHGTARLVVTAKTGDVYRFDKAKPGSRLVVPAPHGTFHLDVLRISGNAVHVTMKREE